jgi:hypothetical protein
MSLPLPECAHGQWQLLDLGRPFERMSGQAMGRDRR